MTSVLSPDKFAEAFADVPEGWGAAAEANNLGDTKIMWDPNDPASVAVAKAAFNEAIGVKKMVAYDVDKSGNRVGGIIREFDPDKSRLILMNQTKGG